MNTPIQKTPRGFYVELTKRAYDVGVSYARKANSGIGFYATWNEVPEAVKKGYVTVVKFIAKELRKKQTGGL